MFDICIIRGISYLRNVQNSDGGIPVGSHNDESGFWTTAEALEALLTSDCVHLEINNLRFVLSMADFLCNSFCESDQGCGFWEGKKGLGPSVITTGNVLFSLGLFSNMISYENVILEDLSNNIQYNFQKMNNQIADVIQKAMRWLFLVRNMDNGWGAKVGSESSIVCCYYVLRAFSVAGRTAKTDPNIYETCTYIFKSMEKSLAKKTRNLTGDDYSCILYGYMALVYADYLTRIDSRFIKRIEKLISRNWKKLQGSYFSENIASISASFYINLPRITLDALLNTETYNFEKKIEHLIKKYYNEQNNDGSWNVVKNDREESTWVTAEVLSDLNMVNSKYKVYKNEVIISQKYMMAKFANIILGLLCLFFSINVIVGGIVDNSNFVIKYGNLAITLVGFVSSVISLFSLKSDK